MIGESGCGKTKLVTFLSRSVLNIDLKIYRVHAGINSQKIN